MDEVSSGPGRIASMPEEPRLPTREECVVRELLLRRAAETPDAGFMQFEGGERWTYAEALECVRRGAAGLERSGVGYGDCVLFW